MKQLIKALPWMCVAVALVLVAFQLSAQDALKIAPQNTKLLLENDQVRVFKFWAKPGFKETMHSHPAHVGYFVKGGKVKFTTADGKSEVREVKAGDAMWSDATTHTVEILGPGDAEAIIIELKGHAAAKPATPAKSPAKK